MPNVPWPWLVTTRSLFAPFEKFATTMPAGVAAVGRGDPVAALKVPSPLKSPAAIATGVLPTAIGELVASEKVPSKVLSPLLSNIEMLFELSLTTARSGLLWLRKFPVTIATGPVSAPATILGSTKGDLGKGVNPPLPSPWKTEIELSPLFATAKSKLPSPLKSAITMALGCLPVANGDPAASANVPSPLPRSTDTVFELELAMTKSAAGVGTAVVEARRTADAIAAGPVSFLPSKIGDVPGWLKLPLLLFRRM